MSIPGRNSCPNCEEAVTTDSFTTYPRRRCSAPCCATAVPKPCLKPEQVTLLKHFAENPRTLDDYWPSIRIVTRSGYAITDAGMWCDYIDLLRFFNKDLRNAKYVCPADLEAEHDRYVELKREHYRKQREQERIREAMRHEQQYRDAKGRFFGIDLTDGKIHVRVLESIEQFRQEGEAMHHCVFTNEYYRRGRFADPLGLDRRPTARNGRGFAIPIGGGAEPGRMQQRQSVPQADYKTRSAQYAPYRKSTDSIILNLSIIRIGAAKAAHNTQTMKTDTNKQNQTYEIRQNGKTVLRSDCEFSLPMIFNNLTGRNFAKKSEYHDYIRFIAIKEMGFTYGEIELVKNGEVVVKGHITKK